MSTLVSSTEVHMQSFEGLQYLSFLLDDEEYGIDILRVQEVRGWTPVTRMPDSPEYLKGVLNLRGAIIPVIDLRKRFGLAAIEYGPTTVVVVVKIAGEDQSRTMGIVVDGVAETYYINPETIQHAPRVRGELRTEFISGLATLEDKMVVLLDLDQLLNSDELAIELPYKQAAPDICLENAS